MQFITPVDIPASPWKLSHNDGLMTLGSCFAESIGDKLRKNRFQVDVNPFGVLYNPESIATALVRLMQPVPFQTEELFRHDGLYHSFSHHSRFSMLDKKACLDGINERLQTSSEWLRSRANRLLVTFGTANVYRLKSTGEVVSNCHKMRDDLFVRERLDVDTIFVHWKSLLEKLLELNPLLKVVFTVSPIRHWKDGAHENQLNKSVLLLTINKLLRTFPEQTIYFPAYEIMLDELRDYRFYAADMIHPSEVAVDYIWSRFGDSFFSKETFSLLKQVENIRKALEHRPFSPQGEKYKQFLTQTLLKMERIHEKSPYIYPWSELEELRIKIND